MRRLINLKLKNGVSVAEHTSEFHSLVNQLASIKMELEDEMQALLLLSSLPDSWETLVVSLSNSAPEGKLTMGMVTDALFNEEARKKEMEGEQSHALVTESRGRDRERGRGRGRSKSRGRSQFRQDNTRRCFYCDQEDHVIRDCPEKKADRQAKEKAKGHGGPSTTAVAVHSSDDEEVLLTISSELETPGWILDSGCTFHICADKKLFSTYRRVSGTVVWVANRNNPITGSQGVLTISGNRSLVLLNGTQNIVWSSNLSRVEEGPVARLLDSGNLVLFGRTETNSDSFLWQSFDFPCNMRIPDLKMGENNRTSLDQYLTSWKSSDDPSPGEFTYRVDNHGLPQLVLRMGSIKKYRSGVKLTFFNLPLYNNPAFKTMLEFNSNRLIYIYEPYNSSVFTRLTLNESGLLQRYILNKKNTWDLMFTVPRDLCDSYGYCGPNGICRIYKSPLCECLKGFIPKSQQEWDVLDWSSGCARSVPLDCQNGEGFVKVVQVKLPDLLEFRLNIGMSIKECEDECLKNCSCIAYANSNISGGGSGCLMWFGDLIDTRESFQDNSDQDIYIRLAASAIG
ncbi:unnamed protein product [Camellia sinensis]